MKNVYCIRHGTAEHNVMFHEIGEEAYMKITDSNLTDKGREESALLGDHWTEKENIDIVFVSPLKRTIQTAINIFKGTNVKMYAFDDLKEYPASYENINHREDKKDLIIKYHKHINFRFLSDKDSLWHDTRHETMEELENIQLKMQNHCRKNNIVIDLVFTDNEKQFGKDIVAFVETLETIGLSLNILEGFELVGLSRLSVLRWIWV